MKPLATKVVFVCGILFGLAVFASAAAAAPAGSAHAKGSLLYVQEAAGGSIERLAGGAYRLRLTGVSPRVTTFTDRPRRRAGRQSLKGFVENWKASGFSADPPNAALVLDQAPTSHDVALLTLSHPHFDRARQTLTYRATPLHGRDAALASFARRADPVKVGGFGPASLFVDDGGSLSSVVFNVTGQATANTVGFLISGSGTWGLASVTPIAIDGTFPINELYETSKALNLGVSPGTSLNFTASLPVEFQGSEPPVVEVTNVSGTITGTWPTDTGPQTQELSAGDPFTLNGLAP